MAKTEKHQMPHLYCLWFCCCRKDNLSVKALHCTKKIPTKRTTPETATFVAVFAFSGNLHATWNKACPFAFSTKSAYKRRFFVVPAYVLQGKVFCTVVFLCLI